jgi:flavin reductase (DIM6/NTAB) family NADH-FMN oxidoreductase RutF
MPMDQVQFRQTMGLFATGITIATTVLDKVPHGMTVNSFTSISLDPTLVLISIDNTKLMHTMLQQSKIFAISVLGESQEHLSRYFSSPTRPHGTGEFDAITSVVHVTGAPVLEGALAWFDCRVSQVTPAGDHTLYVGEVLAMGKGAPTKPLLFYGGKYRTLCEG